jgi:GDP-L-fucose synthase
MEHYDDPSPINVGTGSDVTIADLATIIASTVGYSGTITWDTSKPDGTPRKLLDVERITSTGWRPKISLEDGIASTYAWFTEHVADYRR